MTPLLGVTVSRPCREVFFVSVLHLQFVSSQDFSGQEACCEPILRRALHFFSCRSATFSSWVTSRLTLPKSVR